MKTKQIKPVIIPHHEGFEVEAVVFGPEQIILGTYGTFHDEDGNESQPTPEEEAQIEEFRKEVREKQLHRHRVSMVCTIDRTAKVVVSPVFPPNYARKIAKKVAQMVKQQIKQKRDSLRVAK